MAKTKNLMGDFSFTKFGNMDSGLEIPVSNSLRSPKNSEPGDTTVSPEEPKDQVKSKQAQPGKTRSKQKSGVKIEIATFDYSRKPVEPMIHVVPTSIVVPTRRAVAAPKVIPTKEKTPDTYIDLSEFSLLTSRAERIMYLAVRGWSMRVEQRRNRLYHYAIKYIKRKKRRIYMGPVISQD